jgi:glycosyltransferase involved in cell wall biosynthesis
MPPEFGHLNRHYYLAKYLKRAGYNPIVLVGSYLHNTNIQFINDKTKIKKYEKADFQFYFIKTKNYSKSKLIRVYTMFEYCWNILRIKNELDKPDAIIGSSAHPIAALTAIWLGKKIGCQAIVEIRDLWPESFVTYEIIMRNNPFYKLMLAGEKWIYDKADKLVFTMEGGKDYIVEHKWDIAQGGKIDLDKVFHLNNGVDLELFNANKEKYQFNDVDLDNQNTFKVIYTGSIRLVNKVEKLVEVAKVLKGSNVQILIWGDGDQVEPIIQQIEKERLNNIVLKGRVDKKFVPYILSQADLNIILGDTSKLGSYGMSANKLFEYFAAGKPVILTFKIGHSIVEKNSAGIELESSGTMNIVQSIIRFKKLDQNDYEKFCSNSKTLAQHYDYRQLARNLIGIIENKISITAN